MRLSRQCGKKPLPDSVPIALSGESLSVRLKHNPRAKRLILRMDASDGLPILTCPPGVPLAKIEAFLTANKSWLETQRAKQSPQTLFEPGAVVPFRGMPHTLVHIGGGRGTVRMMEDANGASLLISGDKAHMERRVTDWLKKQARQDLSHAVERHAAALDVKPAAIRIKDTKSRWGSCSSARVLSFSWRIILAPPPVLDYLAAHEVAHLREMNHSARFWAHVATICPNFEESKAWLRQHGLSLHGYG